MRSKSRFAVAILLFCAWAGQSAQAITELSGTLTTEEDGSTLSGHTLGVTRWSVADGTPAGEAIPVEWTVNTDDFGAYRFDLDESLPGMDQLLVFTSDHRVFGELYPNIDLRGVDPKGADIVEAGVALVDLTNGAQVDIDFVVADMRLRQMIPMRDGIRLDTWIYRPSRRPGMQWPVILFRSPYGLFGANSNQLRADYAVVLQNTRGRGDSEGEDLVFDSDGWLTHQDGYDTIEWIADQSFSNERVCMEGKSAPGVTGYFAAATMPEALKCVRAEVAGGNTYEDYYYPGGAFRKNQIETWMLENDSLHKLDEVWEHPNYDAYWDDRNLHNRFSLINVPILHYGGWYDIASQGTLDAFTGLQEGGAQGARRNQKIMMGAWDHNSYSGTQRGQLRYPPNSSFVGRDQMDMDWFDFWLKGVDNGIMDSPPMQAYVMGPGVGTGSIPAGNFWRTSVSWPPPSVETAYYLHPGGVLSTDPPTVTLADTNYMADPDNPVPTSGGNNLYGNIGIGPWDQRIIDNRPDVLFWQTGPLPEAVEVSGPIRMILYASSDQLDTDWVVKLEDRYANGRVMLVMDLILPARHRLGLDREDLLQPGQIYEFVIELWDTSITFGEGHNIRVAIASSNYPRFETNPQTGEPFRQHTATVVATNRVYHDASNQSRLMLPLVPDPAALAGCAATEHVTGLTVSKLAGGEVALSWDAVSDPCHSQYQVFAGIEGPEWPWIVRRPLVETTATQANVTDDGIFWQVVSESTDGSNGPHGSP